MMEGEKSIHEKEIYDAWDDWISNQNPTLKLLDCNLVNMLSFVLSVIYICVCFSISNSQLRYLFFSFLLQIFIPIIYEQHFSCVVFNFYNHSIDYLDNRIYCMKIRQNKVESGFNEHLSSFYTVSHYLVSYFMHSCLFSMYFFGFIRSIKLFSDTLLFHFLRGYFCVIEYFSFFCLYLN